MFDDFKEKLKNRDSKEHAAMLGHVRELVTISRDKISQHFSKWDENDKVFQSRRDKDKEDYTSQTKGQPTKMIVPLTFSEILTFVAFNVMSITQNTRFYELEPTGKEDDLLTEPMEMILERDLRKNMWNTFLIQFFLDIGRFSLAAAEVCYEEVYRHVRTTEEVEVPGAFGSPTKETRQSFTQLPFFVGNKVYSVSPYRFLPDMRLPLSRYQEGEFCGSEDEFSLSRLLGMGDKLFNLDKIPKFTEDAYKQRLDKSRIDLGVMDRSKNPNLYGFGTDASQQGSTFLKSGPVVVTKMVFDMSSKEFGKMHSELDTSLGDEDFPIRYLCWLGNDQTVIRFEEATYYHGQFPYICGQYIADQHHPINQSLGDICEQITNLITWKLNAHIASQKNSVLSKFVVDPAGIDTKNITDSTNPFIYLKKNASLSGVDRYIKQFQTIDTTQNVMADIGNLKDLLESVTGISAQMQGQYSQGRRSATQDRVVAQGAGARGKTTLAGIWDTAFEPLGKQLIANNRQEMDFETFSRIMGKREWPINPDVPPQQDPQTGQVLPVRYTIQDVFTQFQADPISIATSEDFFVFDGTLPSEKAFLAQSLQEILMQVISNPAFAGALGFGPDQVKELFNQIYILRGVTPARLPTGGPMAPPPPPEEGGDKGPKDVREMISLGIKDLEGKEREEGLALFGIHADNAAHEKRLRLENAPPPASKSNGTRS